MGYCAVTSNSNRPLTMSTLSTDWQETHRSIVLPKHCDHYGHMNVRFYAHHFDDGGFQLWNLIGIKQSDLTRGGMGIVVANITIDFIHEMTAGQLIVIKGGWISLGRKSMSHEQRMFEADSGILCAIQNTVEVCFDMKRRKPAPLTEKIKESIKAHLLPQAKLVR